MKRKINALSRATKKMVSILLAIVFTIAMTTGCSNSTTNDNASAPSEAKTPATPQNINCSSIVNSEPSETRVTEDSSSTDESKDISSSSESEEPVDGDDSSSSGTTPADGLYTYTVYGDIEIRMGINIDDYIFLNSEGESFVNIYKIATNYGWLGEDVYSDPDSSDMDAYSSHYFTYHNGELTTQFFPTNWTESIGDTDTYQLRYLNVNYLRSGTTDEYYSKDNQDPKYFDTRAEIGKHYDSCTYRNVGARNWVLSRDDLIIIAYILWYENVNPGECALYAVPGLNTERFSNSALNGRYTLP